MEAVRVSLAEVVAVGRHAVRARGATDMGVRGTQAVDSRIHGNPMATILTVRRVEAGTAHFGKVADKDPE